MAEKKEVEIELSNEVFLKIALMAHEADITFNQMCEVILKKHIEELNKNERNKK